MINKDKDVSEFNGYECFHCGANAVAWDGDFNSEEYGYDRPGIVHECHCMNCGAYITYVILEGEEE